MKIAHIAFLEAFIRCMSESIEYRLWTLFSDKLLVKTAYKAYIRCRILPPFLYNAGDPGKGGFSNDLFMKICYIFKYT